MNDPRRRTVLKAIASTGTLAALGGVGTAAARRGRDSRGGASAEPTILDIVDGDDRFETLALALETAELATVLDGNEQYTVFAPTDAAFERLLESLEVSAAELLARDDLATILLYHVTRGRRYASSILNAPEIRMVEGGSVSVRGTTLNDGQATIRGTDVEASNGVVHVIDGVLLPG